MNSLHLDARRKRELEIELRSTRDARMLRRALALLEIHNGNSATATARQLGVSARSVERWIDEERTQAMFGPFRLKPDPGGRPPVWTEEIEEFLKALLSHSPDHLGYQATSWSVPLLKRHVSYWADEEMSEHTIRRHLHLMGYVWKRPRYVLQADPDRARKMREIRKMVAKLDDRCVLLFEDETDLLLFPPLRATWAERGTRARVQISGWNEKRVIFGAINIRTGHVLCLARNHQRAQDFQFFLRFLTWHYRGWHVVIVLDSDKSHTARSTLLMARAIGVELIFLPYRSPELNPIDTLWGKAKDAVCSNRQYEDIEDQTDQFVAYLQELSPSTALHKAGVDPQRFWIWK